MAARVGQAATRSRQGDVPTPLQPGAVGVGGLLMQSMTHLAPAVSLVFAFPFIVAFAGVATP